MICASLDLHHGLWEQLPARYEYESFVEVQGTDAADRAIGHGEFFLGPGQ